MTAKDAVAELALDGVWTAAQLDERRRTWGFPGIDRYIRRSRVRLRTTAWDSAGVPATVVSLNEAGRDAARRMGVEPRSVRPGEIEHAVGIAELRFIVGARRGSFMPRGDLESAHRRLRALSGMGLMDSVADGAVVTDGGVVLLEYDHGRYTSGQVRAKARAQRSALAWGDHRVLGAVWGAPTARRAEWLRSQGIAHVVAIQFDRVAGRGRAR
jgi:hypothetical protein